MRILHITAMAPLSPNSGIPAVLKALSDEQNMIEDTEAIVLSLIDKADKIEAQNFVHIEKSKLSSFLDSYKPDVAVFHSFYHLEYAYLSNLLSHKKIAYFIEPHGSFGHAALKKSAIKKFVADRTVFRQLIRKATGFIFTNEAEKRDSVYKSQNMLVIPNGVFEAVIHSSIKKTEKLRTDPVFYFLGRFDINHKGLDYLLDAIEILDKKGKKYRFYFYGTGTDEQVKYVNNRIEKLKNMEVQNKGTIYGAEKKEALESACILVLTSRYEGSPMTVLDALSYGNPCIVTPGTNVADEIEKNGLGWKCALGANDIAKTIEFAAKEYALNSERFFEHTKKYALEKYSWPKIAKQSVLEYESVLL